MLAAAAAAVGYLRGEVPGRYGLISTSTPSAPPAIPLMPNGQGYVRVQTTSGSTGCSINTELVACQTAANKWPTTPGGRHYHAVSVTSDGQLHWVEADLGALEGRVALDDQTYSAQGWTIVATPESTRFTNDRSGHGMSVSDQSVTSF
ncbi:hypothetical protein [Mycobacterium paraseoulense]|uniref:Uncharacterized protein n=2 Tax=Mycobacterium paraseoulense TaxID=590652 RepID=A0A1X0IAP4_9MYCO|nr:hypothetical protein [Mycobacterium paraseoulense]MCV7398010.1 hypothetical protein [Mycobacterium paraseoulense]ORB41071.1 hypothetical protein BST39_12785 [Mycobacterium paraseoulense]BBZ70253.1 hypothetical protein MPRS_13460 [Mycobacterium paraseoulense]